MVWVMIGVWSLAPGPGPWTLVTCPWSFVLAPWSRSLALVPGPCCMAAGPCSIASCPWSLGSLGLSLELWGCFRSFGWLHGFGFAPVLWGRPSSRAKALPQGQRGCPWSFGGCLSGLGFPKGLELSQRLGVVPGVLGCPSAKSCPKARDFLSRFSVQGLFSPCVVFGP